MPKTVPLGQSFKYLRDQAAKAVPVGGATPGGDGPPPGFVFLQSPITGENLTSPVTGQPLWKAA